ncbi:hypothetical protein J6590_052243 [Homalodisca vitripennis]|nr:hypothetical protein J6590_052243 [Homalodisca vitripennis]
MNARVIFAVELAQLAWSTDVNATAIIGQLSIAASCCDVSGCYRSVDSRQLDIFIDVQTFSENIKLRPSLYIAQVFALYGMECVYYI